MVEIDDDVCLVKERVITATIRTERRADVDAIRAVTAAAFAGAPHASGSEPRIVDALRNAGALSVSLVAEVLDRIVGHVAVSPVQTSDATPGWFGLGPISVAPDHQRRGIGTLLMNEALNTLRRSGAQGCVLVGDPGYYRRFGFRTYSGLTYAGVPKQYFQALRFGGSLPTGAVTYHEAFADA